MKMVKLAVINYIPKLTNSMLPIAFLLEDNINLEFRKLNKFTLLNQMFEEEAINDLKFELKVLENIKDRGIIEITKEINENLNSSMEISNIKEVMIFQESISEYANIIEENILFLNGKKEENSSKNSTINSIKNIYKSQKGIVLKELKLNLNNKYHPIVWNLGNENEKIIMDSHKIVNSSKSLKSIESKFTESKIIKEYSDYKNPIIIAYNPNNLHIDPLKEIAYKDNINFITSNNIKEIHKELIKIA